MVGDRGADGIVLGERDSEGIVHPFDQLLPRGPGAVQSARELEKGKGRDLFEEGIQLPPDESLVLV